MTKLRASGGAALCALILVAPLSAQGADRIWGEVRTTTGEVHRGFIRWDRNEGSWVDVLDGIKEVPRENYFAWLQSRGADGPPVRVVDLLGYRISWNEADRDFPASVPSGIRFGHLRSLEVLSEGAVELVLRSGVSVRMESRASDLGPGIRELTVETDGDGLVELEWEDLERVDFAAAPADEHPSAARLFGTVTDERGRRFTGYLSWDLDEILESDELDGDEMHGGRDRSIPFSQIESIARIERGARVLLRDGRTLDLTGSNDVDRGHRGVQISDPALGMVEVEWRDFDSVRFHAPESDTGYDAFGGDGPLLGIVETTSGERIEGVIRWDADEGETWEMLDGFSEGVDFTIELGEVAHVVREDPNGATVTLRDGRRFTLDRTDDVSWGNRGILVASPAALQRAPRPPAARATVWRVIEWGAVSSVRFVDRLESVGGRDGS